MSIENKQESTPELKLDQAELEYSQKAELLMAEPEIKHLLEIMQMSTAKGDATQDTLRVYTSQMRRYFIWCVKHNLHPLTIDIDAVIRLRAELRQQGYDYTTIDNKLTIIRRFYKEAAKRDKISTLVVDELKAPKDKNALVRETNVLYPHEVEKVIQALPWDDSEQSLRLRAAVYLMLLQGLRVVEVHRMSVEDIRSEKREILVKGKGKNAFIYPRQDTWDELMKYIQVRKNVVRDKLGTPVFVATGNRARGKRISRDSLRDFVNELFAKVGINKLGKSCHAFRHTYGTMLYQETGDLRLVQEELRHSKIETTTRYTHILDRHLNRPSERLKINTKPEIKLEDLQNKPSKND